MVHVAALERAEAALERERALADRLARAIRAVVETDDAFKEAEGKHGQCVHGRYDYEGCEACIGEFLTPVLAAYDAARKGEPT